MCTSSPIPPSAFPSHFASLRSSLAFECCEGREYIDLWSCLTDSWAWSSIPFATPAVLLNFQISTVGSVPGSVSDGQSESHWSWWCSKQPQFAGMECHFPTVFSWGWERKNLTKKMLIWLLFPNIGEAGLPAANKNTFSETRKKWPDCTSPVAVSPSASTLHSWQIGTCCVQESIPPMGDHETNPWCHWYMTLKFEVSQYFINRTLQPCLESLCSNLTKLWKSTCMTYSSPPRSWGRLGCLEMAVFFSHT